MLPVVSSDNVLFIGHPCVSVNRLEVDNCSNAVTITKHSPMYIRLVFFSFIYIYLLSYGTYLSTLVLGLN